MKRILYLPLGILFFIVMIVAVVISLPQVMYYLGREFITGEEFLDEKILIDRVMDWFDDRNS